MMGSAKKTDEATMSEWERRIGDYGTLRLRLRTAEMLGLPARVCGVRNCRRTRSCLLVFTHNRLPLCYTMLTEDERKAHDEFFDFATSVYEAAQSGHFGNLYRLLIDKPPEYHQAVTAGAVRRRVLASDDLAPDCKASSSAAPPVKLASTPGWHTCPGSA